MLQGTHLRHVCVYYLYSLLQVCNVICIWKWKTYGAAVHVVFIDELLL